MPDLTSIHNRLADIYTDLAANVTNIYGRQDLHLVIDLVYHSPISFWFDGRRIRKAYPEALIIGDTRCLGGETLIYDPVAGISRPVSEIKEEFHVHAWDGEKLVVAKAEKPFTKDVDKLYTVTLSTGDSFVCSKSHVVLTPDGWRAIGQLQEGCAVFHPQSMQDISQLTRVEDVQHCCQKVAGSLSDCPVCSRLRDAQPLLEADTDLAPSPLQDDARLHTSVEAYAHTDATEHAPSRNHQHPNCVHPSRKDDQSPYSIHADKQCHASSTPCVSGDDPRPASLQSTAVYVPPSPIPEVALLDTHFYSSVPYDAPFSVISSIVYKRDDVKWDFTVPVLHNYLCGGIIHHNTGKTQCAEMLQQHYGLGVMAQSETMSLAGLIGGVEQQAQKTWAITWGKLPQNNRRLVILDEASGLKVEDIGKLSSIRSSGIATIEKIRNQSTEAKTRMIWLSNPRESMTVNQFSSGTDIIETLCPAPEDIARFDLAIIVAKDDVDQKMLRHGKRRPKHVYTPKLCHDLVLWCWTRGPKEVILSEETENACFDEGERLSKKYSSDFPLVIGAEQRIKMARLAVALAGRLYSTEDGKNLIVKPEHVHYISDFLDRIYSNKHFGYDNWSINRTLGSAIINPSRIISFMEKIKRLGCLKMLELKKVCLRDLEETMGISSDEARTHIAMLYTNNAIRKERGIYYTKSPEFNDMLREYGHKELTEPEREY